MIMNCPKCNEVLSEFIFAGVIKGTHYCKKCNVSYYLGQKSKKLVLHYNYNK